MTYKRHILSVPFKTDTSYKNELSFNLRWHAYNVKKTEALYMLLDTGSVFRLCYRDTQNYGVRLWRCPTR